MPTLTSNTTTFNLDLSAMAEEAYERCGKEMRTGYDLRTARRSLNLLLIEWANRGINLWTLEQGSQALTASDGQYDIPVDTVDILDAVIRTGTGTSQADLIVSRISASVYASIPNKNATGRPLQYWFQRKTGATSSASVVQYPQLYLWPVPDDATTYTFVYWRLRRMYDAGNGVTGQDVPWRMLPALTAGLAYYLSMKIPEVALDKRAVLKMEYDQQWDLAAGEDREKASVRFVPRVSPV